MRKKAVTVFLLFLVVLIGSLIYVSFFSDFAMPGQGCGSKLSILPHANKACIFPFSCKNLGKDVIGGVCSL